MKFILFRSPLMRRPWFIACLALIVLTLVSLSVLVGSRGWADIDPVVVDYATKSPMLNDRLGRVMSVERRPYARSQIRESLGQGRASASYLVKGARNSIEIEVAMTWDGTTWMVAEAVFYENGKTIRI